MRKKRLFLLLLLLLLPIVAWAEDAAEITSEAVFRSPKGGKQFRYLTDGSYQTIWQSSKEGAWLEITTETEAEYLYASFAKKLTLWSAQVYENDAWRTLPEPEYRVNNQLIRLGGSKKFRLYSEKGWLAVSELHIFTAGDLPAWVNQFEPPLEKADLLVMATHPDDELLWFGGLIPTYNTELGFSVQVVSMAPRYSYRKSELLDALWLCGMKNAPIFGPFEDIPFLSKQEVYASWGGKKKALQYVTDLYESLQPKVVVTQDRKGEYGHGAHMALAQLCIEAVDKAAAAEQPWQVQKLYLHLYGDNPLVMDWSVPLESFDGETSLSVAQRAFKKHASQQSGRYDVCDWGDYDCRVLGLYYSAVGEDEKRTGLFENIAGLEEKEAGAVRVLDGRESKKEEADHEETGT